MANHFSHAALPYPVKKARFTVIVPYLDADGDPTDPTTPDTEISKDAAAYADCSEEVTTITGSNGSGYLTLTGDELNCTLVAIAAKVASGPKNTLMTLVPRVLPILESGTAQAGAAGTITLASGAAAFDLSGCIVRTTGGTGGAGGSGALNNQARIITAYNTSTKVATIEPNWETNPSSDTTYDILLTEVAVNAVRGRFLRPTVDERTLDVSSGGEGGVDWANVGSPTTTVGLSGTTVKTATDVETDTADIQTRIPAALGANGNIKADVRDYNAVAGTFAGGRPEVNTSHAAGTAWGSGAITAAAIAADAITAAKIAADVTTEIQSGLATAASIAALNNLSAAQVNTEVDTAIADARLDELLAADSDIDGAAPPAVGSVFHELLSKTAGSFTFDQTTDSLEAIRDKAADIETDTGTDIPATIATLQADTDNIQTRLPAALVSGRMDASVGAMAAGVVTAAAIATDAIDADAISADAVTEIQSGLSTLTAAGVRTAVGLASANLDTQLDALPTAAENATDVWAAGTRALTDKVGFSLSSAGVQAIWDALTSALTTVGSIGKRIVDNLDAAITTRLASASYTAPDNAGIATASSGVTTLLSRIGSAITITGGKVDAIIQAAGDFAQGAADKAWLAASRTLTAFGFPVTVGTNSDKTGYSLAAGQIVVKKNTALANFTFPMYDGTDHVTPATGLTVTAQRSIDGAAFANCANSASEISAGVYKISLAAADLNGDTIMLKFTAPGADTSFVSIVTQP